MEQITDKKNKSKVLISLMKQIADKKNKSKLPKSVVCESYKSDV